MGDWHFLLSNFIGLMVIILILWWISVRLQDVSFIDAFWAFGMVLLAWASAFQTHGSRERTGLLLFLVTLWGVRLALHLFARWRASGKDPRYVAILGRAMEKKGWSFSRASLLLVFLLQAPLLFIVCLPAQLGMVASEPGLVGWQGWLGAAIALTGIAFESFGDAQLKRFRSNPAMKGKVLETGLWRYTRHPNYFGDACTWWGIWIVAAETVPGLWALPCPILLTWLLMRWSGVPMLERGLSKTRPGYGEYVKRTSAFFPWPPKV
jgi:steroid 5-alpha reductase family enzyme